MPSLSLLKSLGPTPTEMVSDTNMAAVSFWGHQHCGYDVMQKRSISKYSLLIACENSRFSSLLGAEDVSRLYLLKTWHVLNYRLSKSPSSDFIWRGTKDFSYLIGANFTEPNTGQCAWTRLSKSPSSDFIWRGTKTSRD